MLFGLAVFKPVKNRLQRVDFATLICDLLTALITALRAVKRIALGVQEKLRGGFR